MLDDFGRKAIAAIADFDHRGWYGYKPAADVTRPPKVMHIYSGVLSEHDRTV